MSQFTHSSIRPWRDIARELARESDASRRRVLMYELNRSFDPRLATCAICDRVCELTTCKTDEQGKPVHEHCYASKMKNDGNGDR